MNPQLAKFLRSVYRKEPISGFILILGVTDLIIGGVGGQWSLFSIGLIVALMGMTMRWQHGKRMRKVRKKVRVATSRYMLPPESSRTPLPLLTSKKPRR